MLLLFSQICWYNFYAAYHHWKNLAVKNGNLEEKNNTFFKNYIFYGTKKDQLKIVPRNECRRQVRPTKGISKSVNPPISLSFTHIYTHKNTLSPVLAFSLSFCSFLILCSNLSLSCCYGLDNLAALKLK